MTRINNFQTMRITGIVKNCPLHILIDSGSTHNFLNLETAKRLHCRTWVIQLSQVSVANGSKMLSTTMCKDFSWVFHGQDFSTNVMLLPLGSYEIVLGVQRLSTLGPIMWDFEKLQMEFVYKGKKQVLRGIQ